MNIAKNNKHAGGHERARHIYLEGEIIMLVPSILGDTFFDEFFGYPEKTYVKTEQSLGFMQTDVTEGDSEYTVEMSLPGVKKENVKIELKDGYLKVSATTKSESEEKSSNKKYIRKERYSGSGSRTFFVGKELTQEDIKAKFEDGVLKLTVPKADKKPEIEKSKYITIE